MITMNELVDFRVQQQIAHEIYRRQIMQRIPDPFPPMLPIPIPRHVLIPPRVALPGVQVRLQNDDLWKQFHQIGTEMIITKSGRRMFPSMRLALNGLEDEVNYCVLLEMVPIGDCRYKFSGSQWVPAGGAEPQSPQRMYLHPDSPASGSHFQAQPILFNKVKLTNNTLDSNGHIVLASMHKYQPRIHVIRTSDLSQVPWAPQQAFVFPETEFVAVTAYQNDRITKLKIDNNPFAKGFRETGQSRCKRKMSSSPPGTADMNDQDHQQQQQQRQQRQHDMSPITSTLTMSSDCAATICSEKLMQHNMYSNNNSNQKNSSTDGDLGNQIKRLRSNGSACSITSLDDVLVINNGTSLNANNVETSLLSTVSSSVSSSTSEAGLPHVLHEPHSAAAPTTSALLQTQPMQMSAQTAAQLAIGNSPLSGATYSFMQHFHQNMQTLLRPSLVDLASSYFTRPQALYPLPPPPPQPPQPPQSPLSPQPAQHLHIHTEHGMLLNAAAMQQQQQRQLHPQHYAASTPRLHDDYASYSGAATTTTTAPAPTTDIDVNIDAYANSDAAAPLQLQLCDNYDGARTPPQKKKGFSISAILGGSN